MRDIESEMNKAFEGKFFWEPSSHPNDSDSGSSEIRRVQAKIAGKVKIVATRIAADVVDTESIKPVRALKGEKKVVEPLLKAVAKAYGVSPDDIVRRTTSPKLHLAKHHFYWGLFKYTPIKSYAEAGRILGKCHTTVMHGEAMFKRNMDAMMIVAVERELGLV